MMFLVEAANTVKRYSAFPKTITSNPKSHFVFGVLPIAHIYISIRGDLRESTDLAVNKADHF